MERKIKEFFRRHGSRKSIDSTSSPRASTDQIPRKPVPNGARISQTPPAHHEQKPEQVSGTQRERAKSVSIAVGSPQRRSLTRPASKETPAIPEHEHKYSGNSTQESIADNYVAYLPGFQATDESENPRHKSLGGDSRLSNNASLLKHNEDIADRNIERYSSGTISSKQSSLYEGAKRTSVGSVGQGSSGNASSATRRISDRSTGKTSLGRDIVDVEALVVTTDPSSAERRNSDRRDLPIRVARDESHMGWRRRRNSQDSTDDNAPRASNYGPRNVTIEPSDGMTSSAPAVDGAYEVSQYGRPTEYLSRDMDEEPSLEGVVDLNDSVDVDKSTTWAPAVTHEEVKPSIHHITEERIFREIHSYDVYHRVQPVYETEILPPRHFVPNPNGRGLVEVPESAFPECTGANQRWFIGEREVPRGATASRHIGLTEPKIVDEKKYTTPEGFERIETTWLHPATLADMSNYGGPVLPVHFVHHTDEEEARRLNREETRKAKEKKYDKLDGLNGLPEAPPMTLRQLSDALPETEQPIPQEYVPPRSSSIRNKKHHSSATDQKPWV